MVVDIMLIAYSTCQSEWGCNAYNTYFVTIKVGDMGYDAHNNLYITVRVVDVMLTAYSTCQSGWGCNTHNTIYMPVRVGM